MIISLNLLKDGAFPLINVEPHDENHFWRILQNQVFYAETWMPVEGCYSIDVFGNEHITINSKLTGLEKLRTQFHEAIHKILDYPIDGELLILFRSLQTIRDRRDIVAEVLSLVLIFPFWELEKYLLCGDVRPELEPYIAERLNIVEIYGI